MSNSTSGIGFFGLLTILFIGLKLTGYIAWSWFWVLSPLFVIIVPIIILLIFWIIFIIFILMIVLLVLIFTIAIVLIGTIFDW